MPAKKTIGLGCGFGVKFTTGSAAYTPVLGLLSLDGPGPSASPIDVSALDDGTNYEETQGGLVSAGDVSVSFTYDADDAGQQIMAGLLANRLRTSFEVTFPTTMPDETFKGYVNGGGRAIAKGSVITRPFTIGVTGVPGWAADTSS